jgi:hypothetical protein
VIGLTAAGLVLEDNGGDDLPIDGSFKFAKKLAAGAAFTVSIETRALPYERRNADEALDMFEALVRGSFPISHHRPLASWKETTELRAPRSERSVPRRRRWRRGSSWTDASETRRFHATSRVGVGSPRRSVIREGYLPFAGDAWTVARRQTASARRR